MNARLSPVADSRISVTREHASEKSEMLTKLKALLQRSFDLRQTGAHIRDQANAQGYADGYMAMLVDSGLVQQQEALALVQGARRGSFGPATGSSSLREFDEPSSAVLVA